MKYKRIIYIAIGILIFFVFAYSIFTGRQLEGYDFEGVEL